MKTEQELKEWFWDLYNSCYIVKHDDKPDLVFLLYDENFIRQAKLKTILDEEIIYPEKPNGVCLFEQDWENKRLWVDYNTIWSVFEIELGYKYQEIKNLITCWLDEYDKPNVLKPTIQREYMKLITISTLCENNNLKVLIPMLGMFTPIASLNEHDKLKVLKK